MWSIKISVKNTLFSFLMKYMINFYKYCQYNMRLCSSFEFKFLQMFYHTDSELISSVVCFWDCWVQLVSFYTQAIGNIAFLKRTHKFAWNTGFHTKPWRDIWAISSTIASLLSFCLALRKMNFFPKSSCSGHSCTYEGIGVTEEGTNKWSY